MQTTIRSTVTFTGVGLHSGRPARMRVHAASANFGVWFRRTDVIGADPMVPAIWDAVIPAQLCTRIENASGVSVSTIEHIMAALAGCGVHNALIEIDGPEVPILDGSSAPFVSGILARGLRSLDQDVRCFEILKPVEVHGGDAYARLEPAETLEIDFRIQFEDAAIGRQEKRMTLANGAFVRELSDSRTFCRQSDVDAMRANGLALGGTYENAVVVDGDRVLSPGGLRHQDEAVRHKMLDALGDLALAGAPILGRYTGNRAGHAMTNRLLRALFADPTAFRVVECAADRRARLPGVGVSRADIPAVA
ncbi:UDP-3-O-acyl-N-acetylglucosamine deacetylase [Defluviimonas sp. WL0002]|uniref:UDP-3-O-acyl-N-acetylglucosamine deacetylase n=1 Tax=Albidovulum marisflavi TaxID=2984159 RepID=A0ABT2ZDB8_9RHOB|nr:UDP-3-O-acyl-N-acetylglucosamine deacetylase [Defluviimonas sp. WL0002]MCV2869138.1 UDP-3-O-acyl-N-acetylglucosamine deacetylase [Defluviimonas sp. WL0002]